MALAEFSLAVRGRLRDTLEAERRAGADAITQVVRRRTNRLKNALRRQADRAGLGDRFGKTIRGDVYPPRGSSLSAAGRVHSKAILKRAGGLVDLWQVFATGGTFRAAAGNWLAVPLPAAGYKAAAFGGRTPNRPSDFPDGALEVYRSPRTNRLLLKRRDDPSGEPLFVLVPQIRLRKVIDLEGASERSTRGLEADVARTWERLAKRRGLV